MNTRSRAGSAEVRGSIPLGSTPIADDQLQPSNQTGTKQPQGYMPDAKPGVSQLEGLPQNRRSCILTCPRSSKSQKGGAP